MKAEPQYTITIREHSRGAWSFRYTGELSLRVRLAILLAGWKATLVTR